MTFGGRRPSVGDDIWWKITFCERQPSVEDDLWWKTTFGWRQHRWKMTLGGGRPWVEDDLLNFCQTWISNSWYIADIEFVWAGGGGVKSFSHKTQWLWWGCVGILTISFSRFLFYEFLVQKIWTELGDVLTPDIGKWMTQKISWILQKSISKRLFEEILENQILVWGRKTIIFPCLWRKEIQENSVTFLDTLNYALTQYKLL